jgi:hypothetical protein
MESFVVFTTVTVWMCWPLAVGWTMAAYISGNTEERK